MARQTVTTFTSDMTGQAIPDGEEVALITISYPDSSKASVRLDATAAEVADLAAKGVAVRPRGRQKKS